MSKSIFKFTVAVIVVILIAVNSVYFEKLDKVKAASMAQQFDAAFYARSFWNNKLLPNLSNAIELNLLIELLKTAPDETFDQYSHALGIGNIRFFLVHGRGQIKAINKDDVSLALETSSGIKTIKIATEYIFGNAVRDASGLIDINEFNNTMHFNNVSVEINKIIRSEVLPPFRIQAKEQLTVEFYGGIELNQAHLNVEQIEVIPISLKVLDKEIDKTQ